MTSVLIGVLIAWLSPGGLFSSPASKTATPGTPSASAAAAPPPSAGQGSVPPATVDPTSVPFPPPVTVATPSPNGLTGARSQPSLPANVPSTNEPLPVGSIQRPVNGQSVPVRVDDVAGTIERIPDGHTVWLVAQITGPPGNPYHEALQRAYPRLWPGPVPVTVRGDKSWTTYMYFGADAQEHAGLQFRLYLIVVDKAVDGQFRTYNQNAEQLGYQGIELRHIAAPVMQLAVVDVVRS
jgi:hypothetical protein